MAIGFPPKYTSQVNLNLRFEDSIELVKETFTYLHWNYRAREPNVFSASGIAPATRFESIPHTVIVKVNEYEGIEVISKNFIPFLFVYDFGSNKELVGTFIEALSLKSLDRSPRFSDSLPNGGRVDKTVINDEK